MHSHDSGSLICVAALCHRESPIQYAVNEHRCASRSCFLADTLASLYEWLCCNI